MSTTVSASSMSPDSPSPGSSSARAANRLTIFWVLVMLALMPILAILGMTLRVGQSNLLPLLDAERFYSIMTLHGLGMVGLWFVAGMAALCALLRRYIELRNWVNWIAFLGTLVGVVMLIIATLIGKYGPGWYFLYPLSITPSGVWQDWVTYTFLSAIAVLGVAWTVWCVEVMWGIARRYTLPSALGWHYITGKDGPEVPPIITITTISMIANLIGLVSAVVMLALYLLELLGVTDVSDALLMKNLVFLFGHILVNITLYLGVAMVYELLPEFTGRTWKNNRLISLAWNVVLALVVFAFFHHLYMDFVQLRWLHVIGQITSYASAIPAAVMSIFGTLAIVYRASTRWTMTSLLLYCGVLGWAIGGIGAVIDSTIAVNTQFHNTLWVPGHFHTYFLMGVVLMILGGAFYLSERLSGVPENVKRSRLIASLICVGGYGFVLMFYVGGANSVPRRFAQYTDTTAHGSTLALIAVLFIAVLLAGLLMYVWETGKRCAIALRAG